jgi:hypothetical protein
MLGAKLDAALISLLFFASLRPASPQKGSAGGSEPGGRDDPIISYQFGAFRDKSNAERLAEELFVRGYYRIVVQKTVQGRNFWVVTVATPSNPFENFQDELLATGLPSSAGRPSLPSFYCETM